MTGEGLGVGSAILSLSRLSENRGASAKEAQGLHSPDRRQPQLNLAAAS